MLLALLLEKLSDQECAFFLLEIDVDNKFVEFDEGCKWAINCWYYHINVRFEINDLRKEVGVPLGFFVGSGVGLFVGFCIRECWTFTFGSLGQLLELNMELIESWIPCWTLTCCIC